MVGQPIDYRIQVQDPFVRSLQGFQMGQQLGTMAQEARQRPMLEAQAAEKRQALLDFVQNPNPIAGDYQRALILNPEIKDQIKQGWEAMTAERKDSMFRGGVQVLGALKAGQTDMAKALLAERAEAERNSGNAQQAQVFDTYAKLVDVNPAALQQIIGLNLSAGDEAKFAESMDKLASAQGRELETEIKAEQRPFDLSKARAESVIKEAEAKFAPQKLLADLGLTRAQTSSAQASAASSYASAEASRATASRARAEAGQINAGVIPAEKRPEAEAKFRKEYSDQTKGYQEVKSAYGRIKASDQTAAGDLSLIFNYMKMLDPGSVVRETEFANAQNAAGVPDRIRNQYNQALNGQRLNPAQRKEFTNQAERLYTQARTQENTVRKGIERIASGYGLKTDNIFYEAEESAPEAPPATMLEPGGGVLRPGAAAASTGGFRIVGRRQQ
jgi:hypothetical protein